MKIFLISTPLGEKNLGEMFQNLYSELERLGYKHVSNYIATRSKDFVDLMEKGKEEQKKFYNEMVESINKADICIFEASTPSFGVGYLIQHSLSVSKPTVVLFYKNYKSYLLPGIDDEKLIVENYDEKNYKKILKKVLEQAREKRDKRFNFFLSPKLLNYLEKVSNDQGVTKSKILRDMIVDHMRKSNSQTEE